jgi:threonine/homoserine/homoserine lactone efflux protein
MAEQNRVPAGGMIFTAGVVYTLSNVYVLLRHTSLYPTFYAVQALQTCIDRARIP